MNDDDSGAERHINIHLSPEVMGGVYANFANVSHSDYEFTVTFARVDHEVEAEEVPGVVVSRVNLSPRFMRELIDAMEDNYSKWRTREGIKNLPEYGGAEAGARGGMNRRSAVRELVDDGFAWRLVPAQPRLVPAQPRLVPAQPRRVRSTATGPAQPPARTPRAYARAIPMRSIVGGCVPISPTSQRGGSGSARFWRDDPLLEGDERLGRVGQRQRERVGAALHGAREPARDRRRPRR